MSSGIYIIQSILFPGRQYVGSAVDFTIRKMVHESSLIAGTHFNAKLQNHFNKYGIDDLLFLKVEKCPREQLLIREQHFIVKLKPYFNICCTAGSRFGTKHNPEAIVKMKASAKRRFRSSRTAALRGRFAKTKLSNCQIRDIKSKT